jgi:hypothetical protein
MEYKKKIKTFLIMLFTESNRDSSGWRTDSADGVDNGGDHHVYRHRRHLDYRSDSRLYFESGSCVQGAVE